MPSTTVKYVGLQPAGIVHVCYPGILSEGNIHYSSLLLNIVIIYSTLCSTIIESLVILKFLAIAIC